MAVHQLKMVRLTSRQRQGLALEIACEIRPELGVQAPTANDADALSESAFAAFPRFGDGAVGSTAGSLFLHRELSRAATPRHDRRTAAFVKVGRGGVSLSAAEGCGSAPFRPAAVRVRPKEHVVRAESWRGLSGCERGSSLTRWLKENHLPGAINTEGLRFSEFTHDGCLISPRVSLIEAQSFATSTKCWSEQR